MAIMQSPPSTNDENLIYLQFGAIINNVAMKFLFRL